MGAVRPCPSARGGLWERDDARARLWHSIAVHCHYEPPFGPSLKSEVQGALKLLAGRFIIALVLNPSRAGLEQSRRAQGKQPQGSE